MRRWHIVWVPNKPAAQHVLPKPAQHEWIVGWDERLLAPRGRSRAADTLALPRHSAPNLHRHLLIVGGFVQTYATWWNGLVALTWLAVQVTRIMREEALLGGDERYQRYALTVRWRLVPWVW